MKKLILSLLLGITAGIIDVIPMIVQGLNGYANSSAFIEWVILGVIITHIELLNLKGWLKGFVVAQLCVLPIVIIVAQNGILGIIPILLMTAILGSMVGFISTKYLARAYNG